MVRVVFHSHRQGLLTCFDVTGEGDVTKTNLAWTYPEIGACSATVSIADGLVYAGGFRHRVLIRLSIISVLTLNLGVIPARVAGIHCAASPRRAKWHGRARIASARREEKWTPVTLASAGAGMHRADAVIWFEVVDRRPKLDEAVPVRNSSNPHRAHTPSPMS